MVAEHGLDPPAPQPALSSAHRAAAGLVCLPEMTPARLRALLDHFGTPEAAHGAVRAGGSASGLVCLERPLDDGDRRALAARWADATRVGPAAEPQLSATLARRGTRVYIDGTPDYPISDAIPDRPAVLLAEGDGAEVLDRPCVGIVGTRSATLHGLHDARELGAHLARRGITVVSGLALGIDGAAHDGAIEAGGGVVGVVATGLDVVYPRRHRALYARVRTGRGGLLISETAFGAGPLRWRFPVRNRIIAALSDVLVVVEATISGGARITAGFALDYDRPVLAVPGSRRNPSAAGCNALLADGAHPLLEPDDVLVALGMTPGSRRGWGSRAAGATRPTGDAAALLRACGGEPATPDQLASRTGLAPGAVALAVRTLERDQLVAVTDGMVWPR